MATTTLFPVHPTQPTATHKEYTECTPRYFSTSGASQLQHVQVVIRVHKRPPPAVSQGRSCTISNQMRTRAVPMSSTSASTVADRSVPDRGVLDPAPPPPPLT